MKKRFSNSLYLTGAVFCWFAICWFATSAEAQPSAPAPSPSPAEIAIRKALEEISKHAGHYPYYNNLAMAYARRARETSDARYYAKAAETLQESFRLSPDNFDGMKVHTCVLLGRHEFAKALEAAAKLNKRTPDDITVYGYLADANTELGNYKEAVEAAQWMLDLRVGNIEGLTRAGRLRELHGDINGAIEMIQLAYDATPFQETEDRAWLLTRMAHLNLLAGELRKSELHATSALRLFPGYHNALGALAQVRLAQKRYDDAVSLFEKRYNAAPNAENLYAVGEALERAGRQAEAAEALAEFERQALPESSQAGNANHELIAYYADFAKEPAKAIQIAEQELARRHDVFTLDSYAWSLAANGDYAHADAEIRKALVVGVKDPGILYHAGVIALRLNRTAEAEKHLRDATSRYSSNAERVLQDMAHPVQAATR